MKCFWSLVQIVSIIGVIVSLIICVLIPPIGIILLIDNIYTMSSASKEIEKIEINGRKLNGK